MVARGRIQNGVVVLEDDIRLPEGTRVIVLPDSVAQTDTVVTDKDRISEDEHRRLLEAIDRIAALPIEGKTDPFSGADHDKVLYGKP